MVGVGVGERADHRLKGSIRSLGDDVVRIAIFVEIPHRVDEVATRPIGVVHGAIDGVEDGESRAVVGHATTRTERRVVVEVVRVAVPIEVPDDRERRRDRRPPEARPTAVERDHVRSVRPEHLLRQVVIVQVPDYAVEQVGGLVLSDGHVGLQRGDLRR